MLNNVLPGKPKLTGIMQHAKQNQINYIIVSVKRIQLKYVCDLNTKDTEITILKLFEEFLSSSYLNLSGFVSKNCYSIWTEATIKNWY